MSTTEIAEIAVERVDGLRLPALGGGAALRAGLYVAVLVVWSATYGIPVQRELVIAWICGALACASIGRHPRQILQLVLDWLPIVVVLGAYDFTRGAADSLGIGVHVHPMIDFDRFVFFGQTPTEWLQARLHEPGVVSWWDVAFTLIYTSYFIVPFALAGVLWARDRLAFLRFTKRLVTARPRRPRHLHPLPGGAALDGGAKWACSKASTGRPPKAGRCSAVGHRGPLLRGPGERQPRRRRALAALRLHRPGRDVPLGAASAGRLRPLLAALSAGDGPDADRDRRALLLRRRCSAGSTPAR